MSNPNDGVCTLKYYDWQNLVGDCSGPMLRRHVTAMSRQSCYCERHARMLLAYTATERKMAMSEFLESLTADGRSALFEKMKVISLEKDFVPYAQRPTLHAPDGAKSRLISRSSVAVTLSNSRRR